jgi:hypothetical protein
MKYYIKAYYPDRLGGRQYTYDQLREIVREPWDSISAETLKEIIDCMKDRCEAVILAKGGYTLY